MTHLRVLCLFQIKHDDTRCHHSAMQVIHPESLEVFHSEVLIEPLAGGALGEGPVVHLEGGMPCAERAIEHRALATLIEDLLGSEVLHQLIDVLGCSLGGEKLAGADIQECQTAGGLAEVDGCQEVVLAAVEHVLRHGHTRCNELRDAALH